MQINLSWILIAFIVGPVALQSPEIKENLDYANQVRQQTKANQRESNESRLLAEQSKSDSEIALQRVNSGCVPVISAVSGNDTRLAENMPIVVRDSDGVTLSDGSIVCSAHRDTGEVWGGKIYQVKRIAPEHQEEYDTVFKGL